YATSQSLQHAVKSSEAIKSASKARDLLAARGEATVLAPTASTSANARVKSSGGNGRPVSMAMGTSGSQQSQSGSQQQQQQGGGRLQYERAGTPQNQNQNHGEEVGSGRLAPGRQQGYRHSIVF
ncbi:hypothetical protein HDU76_007594, partial [Blyttiomyces sp. JEL0837]